MGYSEAWGIASQSTVLTLVSETEGVILELVPRSETFSVIGVLYAIEAMLALGYAITKVARPEKNKIVLTGLKK